MRRIVEGLYQLEAGGFVNSYLIVGSSDLTLIDAGPARSADALLAELKDNGFDFSDVARVVLTHSHPDHVGGLHALVERRRIKVHAHPKAVPVLTGKEAPPPLHGLKGFCMDFLHEQVLAWKPIDSVIAISLGTPLRGITRWQIMYTPGHTADSISLFDPVKQVLLCGDVLSNRGGAPARSGGLLQPGSGGSARLT